MKDPDHLSQSNNEGIDFQIEIDPESDNQTKKSLDIWALGLVLHLLIFGKYPFQSQAEFDQLIQSGQDYLNLFSEPSDTQASPEVKDLIHKCLQIDPFKRPTIAEIRNHDWFSMDSQVLKYYLD